MNEPVEHVFGRYLRFPAAMNIIGCMGPYIRFPRLEKGFCPLQVLLAKSEHPKRLQVIKTIQQKPRTSIKHPETQKLEQNPNSHIAKLSVPIESSPGQGLLTCNRSTDRTGPRVVHKKPKGCQPPRGTSWFSYKGVLRN